VFSSLQGGVSVHTSSTGVAMSNSG